MPSGGDSGGNWIFLSIEHVLDLEPEPWSSLSVCMCMLSTYLSCIDASLLLSISIKKVSYRQYRSVSIHARAALHMRKVYVVKRKSVMPSGGDSGGN